MLPSFRALSKRTPGASYGAFVLLDDSWGIADYRASGRTAEQAQRMWARPDGLRFVEYLSRTEEFLRLPDLLGHISS